MIYPDTAVRAKVYSLLKAANIPAYDSEVTVSGKPPYVLLQTQENSPQGTKSKYGFLHRITLAAVTIGSAGSGKADAEALMNKALPVLIPDKPGQPVKIVLGNPFRCWKASANPGKDLVFTGSTESVYQKIVTLELSIDYQP